jgi:hypothetical protein
MAEKYCGAAILLQVRGKLTCSPVGGCHSCANFVNQLRVVVTAAMRKFVISCLAALGTGTTGGALFRPANDQ